MWDEGQEADPVNIEAEWVRANRLAATAPCWYMSRVSVELECRISS
jgi:hypothetical protein